jgi:predicted metal-dependent hydrolase
MEKVIDGRNILYHIQYGKGKKPTIIYGEEEMIFLKLPNNYREEEIEIFLISNKDNIFKHLDKFENRKYIKAKKEYDLEENFMYLGKPVKLSELVKDNEISEDKITDFLYSFYTKKTREIILKRVSFFEKEIGVKAKGIKIVDSKASWGTCNNKHELTFNYRLSMAAPVVIDYVIIHELCHILHLNHDRSFWRKVGSYDKDYKSKQDYLLKLGPYMNI